MDRACLEKTAAFCRAVVSFCVCAVAFLAYAENYDSLYTADTGYVTMKKNDSNTASGFAGTGQWSDGRQPHSDTNYYVGTERTFCTPNDASFNGHAFEGNRLVVGGKISHTAGSGKTISWGDTEFLPGSVYHFSSIGNIIAGSFTVRGTEENPFRFNINRNSGSVYEIIQSMDMVSDGSGYTVVDQKGSVRQMFTYRGDWSGYHGTFVCPTNLYIQLDKGFGSPGKFVVPEGGVLACLSNDSVVALGSLDVASGGKVCFKGSAEGTLLYVTNNLSLAAGAIVDTSNFFNRADSAIHTSMVFRLSPKVVEAGLPDWDKIVYPYRKKGALGDLPNIVPFVMDDPEVEGGKYMGVRMKEIVYMTNTCSHGKSALDLTYNKPEEFWSDGQWPAAGKDYVIAMNYQTDGNVNPYVFPGDSVTVLGVYFGMYSEMNDITYSNLVFLGKSVIRPLDGSASNTLRGTLKLMADGDYPDPAQIALYNNQYFNIASDISGSNKLCAYALRYGGQLTIPVGTVRLSGDNTAWTGKLLVAGTNDVYDTTKGLCELNALTNLTLRVTDSKNLGGTLPEFTYDALTVSNQCRLAIDGTTVFAETTRGWYFPRTAYLYVTNDATATCLNTLTIGGELVKEGSGTLCISSVPAIEGETASISVKEGVLAAGTSDAFKGLAVNFAPDASLGIDVGSSNEGFAAKGLDITDVVLSSDTGTIPVSLLGGEFKPDVKNGPYALFTCQASQLDELKSSLAIRRPWNGTGMSVSYTEKDNGDGTVTLFASLSPCKLRIIIR